MVDHSTYAGESSSTMVGKALEPLPVLDALQTKGILDPNNPVKGRPLWAWTFLFPNCSQWRSVVALSNRFLMLKKELYIR